MPTWTQNYTPVFDHVGASALVAALPVVVLLGLLAFCHVRAHLAALCGLAAAFAIAIFVYKMPVAMALGAAGYGALYGLLPISWMLIGLGFKPLQAAGLSLIGNTAPVTYGALGTPIIALAQVTGIDIYALSAMTGRQLPFFSVIVPFWIIWAMAGRRAVLEVWPACLVSGMSFAIVQFLVSNFHGPWLVDIAGALVSIGATLVLLRFWQPKTIWRFNDEAAASEVQAARGSVLRPTPAAMRLAWMPWAILTAMEFIWGLPQVKTALNGLWAPTFEVPALHQAVLKAPPLVPAPKVENAIFSLNLLSATGTALLLAALASGLVLGLRPAEPMRAYLGTLWHVRISVLTIAFTSRYGGLDSTMGLAFASTGVLFPFFSALLGWLGVALTGSDTSSNVLFGNLQTITAQQVGISPVLAAASNSSGAQSLVMASVATRQEGSEGSILRLCFLALGRSRLSRRRTGDAPSLCLPRHDSRSRSRPMKHSSLSSSARYRTASCLAAVPLRAGSAPTTRSGAWRLASLRPASH